MTMTRKDVHPWLQSGFSFRESLPRPFRGSSAASVSYTFTIPSAGSFRGFLPRLWFLASQKSNMPAAGALGPMGPWAAAGMFDF